MASPTLKELLDEASRHLQALKITLTEAQFAGAGDHLDVAIEQVAAARKKVVQKGRAGFYAGRSAR